METKVFFCYTRADGEFALRLANDLRSAGINIWIDQLDILPGEDWDYATEKALEACTCLIAILSPNSVKSREVRNELNYALEEEKRIIPVLYKDVKVPYRLRLSQRIDFINNYSAGRTRLIEVLGRDQPSQTEVSKPAKQTVLTKKPTVVTQEQISSSEWFDKALIADDDNKKIKFYTNVLKLDPQYVHAYNNRGLAHQNLGQNDKAIKDYNKAIKLNPEDVDAYINRGNAYDDLGQNDKAIQDYNKAIKLNPEYVQAYNNRGLAYIDLGQNDKAIQDFNKAIKLDPEYVHAYFNRGLAYKNSGQDKDAVDDYNKYLEISGEYAEDVDKVRQWIKDLGYIPKY